MRRILASVGGVALATSLLTAPAMAAPSEHFSDTQTVLLCEGITGEAGTVFAFVAESETFGSFADLAFWATDVSPETDDPTWISVTGSAEFAGTSVSASLDLVEFERQANPEDPPFGDPVGTATLEATITPIGAPHRYSTGEGFGNQKFRRQGVVQDFSVEGTLELPTGITFDLSACAAAHDTFSVFMNAPASSVYHATQFVLDCHWDLDGTFVNLFAVADEFETFSNVFVSGPDLELLGVTASPVTLTTEEYAASFELIDVLDETATEPVGSAEATATLTAGGRVNERFTFGNSKVHVTGTAYAVAGNLSLTIADATYQLPMDSESCRAADQRVSQLDSARQGPKGKPLPNDAPEGALPIAIGDEVRVRTFGTVPDPEAPCIGEFDGQEVEFPISKTAWWTFEGTGGDVTIDTAGSDFDTIVGVYADDGSGLAPIGCVDDVDGTFQARITIATDAGVTYFVQAGGFDGQAGTLVLSVN